MGRFLVFGYGVISYLLFLISFLYLIAFNGNFLVPKTVDSGQPQGWLLAVVINIGLMALFGVQHSVMARPAFKRWITRFIPESMERSTYVLATVMVLVPMMAFWQPVGGVIWQVDNTAGITLLYGLMAIGWLLVLVSTFLTDHFDLFGLRQVYLELIKRSYTAIPFTERLVYQWVRHPMMLGLLVAFWSIPAMSYGHLLFSTGMTLYIFIGIHYEERGLAETLGEEYVRYQQRTSAVFPGLSRKE